MTQVQHAALPYLPRPVGFPNYFFGSMLKAHNLVPSGRLWSKRHRTPAPGTSRRASRACPRPWLRAPSPWQRPCWPWRKNRRPTLPSCRCRRSWLLCRSAFGDGHHRLIRAGAIQSEAAIELHRLLGAHDAWHFAIIAVGLVDVIRGDREIADRVGYPRE